jgi:hypothetical protein
MPRRNDGLVQVMREPARIAGLSLRDWDVLIPQARQSGLLGRLALAAERAVGLEAIPERPANHLRSALALIEKHRRDVVYELDRVGHSLRRVLPRIVLLKGAAYVAGGLPPAQGRVFSDIDILVPIERLPAVEAALTISGWRFGKISQYGYDPDEEAIKPPNPKTPPL